MFSILRLLRVKHRLHVFPQNAVLINEHIIVLSCVYIEVFWLE